MATETTTSSEGLSFQKLSYPTANSTVHVHILKLAGSALVLFNDQVLSMASLAVAMSSRYEKTPIVTNLIGDSSNLLPQNLARRLCMKLNQQVYVSCDLSDEQFAALMAISGKEIFNDIMKATKE